MQRHRLLVQTIKESTDIIRDLNLGHRISYYKLEFLKAEAKKLEIKLLVQVPTNFVQNLIDQTFLK